MKSSTIYTYNPELGGNTFDIFVEEGTTYEIQGSYRVYFNGTMSKQYNCDGWCPIYNLTPGYVNTIIGSGEIKRYQKLTRTDYDIVVPEEPAIVISLTNKFWTELKPGYIEDIDLTLKNNNRRSYKIDRIALELYDQGEPTGTATIFNYTFNLYENAKVIDLYTDTNGFTLPPEQTTYKKYKIYIPEGVPLDAMLIVKAVEKYGWRDESWYRSNLDDLLPIPTSFSMWGGPYYSYNLSQSSLYNSSNISLITNDYYWASQDFDFFDGCDGDYGCEERESFLRKYVWVPGTVIKSEQKQELSQECTAYFVEAPSGITTWINGELKSSYNTECNVITAGWTPNYYELKPGQNNEFDIYQYGPHRSFDIQFYEVVAIDYIRGATVEPFKKAFDFNITGIGHNGLLRRGYEEIVNVTVVNNDDDPVSVDVITLELITPKGKKMHLLTDTTPRVVEGKINLSYTVIIPLDVPLNSKMRVQVERVFEFPDKLWNRDQEATRNEFIGEGYYDYPWGDTLPTSTSSYYRKHFFVPEDVTRGELILGGDYNTEAYLNGEYQGRGYPGWSPIAVTTGLRPGEDNLYSVSGSIPDTESRIYSGKVKTAGSVIEVEQEVFYMVFGIREDNFIPNREPFYVLPGEKVTARIEITNKYNLTLDFDLRLYTIDFKDLSETTLKTHSISVKPYETKYLEFYLTIPSTVSNETRLQLSGVYKEKLLDKNWLRGSNFEDEIAKNIFYEDSSWGVVEFSDKNEKAIYYRKHVWVDSLTEDIQIKTSGAEKLWVNGLEVQNMQNGVYFELENNEMTKSYDNLFTLKATNFDVDADIILKHFVPVRSTDLEITNATYSN
ncbi:MAG: hypothetical protein ACE5KE_07785, partial [Methanosarcinales archaeon]